MKSKGAIKFFAIALAVVCLFQLSFTFVAKSIESDADEFASMNAKKFGSTTKARSHYLDSMKHETVYNLGFGDFTLHKYNYADVKERELNLGLDLRGGIHVTLEVAEDKLLRELSGNNPSPELNRALAEAKTASITSQRNFVDVFADKFNEIKPGVQLAGYFANSSNSQYINRNSSNSQVVNYLKEESKSALDRTYKILRTRIDQFGVTQPSINVDANSGRVLVELPGADDPDRVRNLLKKSAKLEFFKTFTINEVYPFIEDADKKFHSIELNERAQSRDPKALAAVKKDSADQVSLDSIQNLMTAAGNDTSKLRSLDQARQKIYQGKSADDLPLFSKLNMSNELMQSNSPIIGFVRISDTARVNQILNTPEVKSLFPGEVIFAYSAKPRQGTDALEFYALRGPDPVLTGEVIKDARADIDPQTNTHVVNMQMDAQGAAEWAGITKQAAAQKPQGSIAIVLDRSVYSAPVVKNEIPNGSSVISGNFLAEDSKDLANVLKAGKLPVELDVIDQAVVGPSLGVDAIEKGLISLLIGVVVIIVFMVAYYNRGGWVANVSVIINLFFIIGILTSLGAALTLPGMAGIVLTLAMAVDANVIIYERIREEQDLGKSIRQSIHDGFKHAMSAVIDGNLTTLLIGIILMAFGTGPIYGFAIILVIGILTTLFCQILLSRLIFEWLLKKDVKLNFGNKVTQNLFRNFHFDFIGKRRIGYAFSLITFLLAVGSLAFRGLNYDVEFKGGYSYTVQFDKTPNVEQVREQLTKTFDSEPEIKTFGSNNTLLITTDYLLNENSDQTDQKVQTALHDGLKASGYETKVLSSNKVGSTIASDIRNSAFMSILFGLIGVFLYIILRFRKWQFALGATLSLAHDAIVVLGVFSIFKDILPFTTIDQEIIAAVLTVIGYSVNDTVIVFDRIREYVGENKKKPLIPVVNDAINHTLNRTVITSVTVLLAIIILFIFGGPVIRGFSFAMMLGVVLGTYSSIFVATPIAVDLQRKQAAAEEKNPKLAKA